MKQELKNLVEKFADRLGYQIYPKWRIEQLGSIGFAEHLNKLFSYLDVDTVVDVGANEGQYRYFLRREVGFKGKIISFEPNPSLIAKLQADARSDNLWEIHNLGLGSSEGKLKLHITGSSVFSSFANQVRIIQKSLTSGMAWSKKEKWKSLPLLNLLIIIPHCTTQKSI